jgi:hypothetical protein
MIARRSCVRPTHLRLTVRASERRHVATEELRARILLVGADDVARYLPALLVKAHDVFVLAQHGELRPVDRAELLGAQAEHQRTERVDLHERLATVQVPPQRGRHRPLAARSTQCGQP